MDFRTALAIELKGGGIQNRARRDRRRDTASRSDYDAAIISASSRDPKNPGGDQGEYEGAQRAMKWRQIAKGRSRHGGRRGLRRMSGGY